MIHGHLLCTKIIYFELGFLEAVPEHIFSSSELHLLLLFIYLAVSSPSWR